MSFRLYAKDTPNQSVRTSKPMYLVTHDTEGSYDSAVAWLTNSAAEASADEVISRDGTKVTTLVSNIMHKSWEVGNANSLCYGFEAEGMTASPHRTDLTDNFYDTVAQRMIAAQKRIKAAYGVEIPLRRTYTKGVPGIAPHRVIAAWYGGSDHTDGEWDYTKLEAAINRHLGVEAAYYQQVWQDKKVVRSIKYGGGRVAAYLKSREFAALLKKGQVILRRVKR